jgi:protease YdgD
LPPSRPRRRRLPAAELGKTAVVAALLLLCCPSVAAAEADRAEAWPWSAVGRVLRDGKGPCSGVLIEPRTVLTVGHCVAGGRPWRAKPAERLTVMLDGRVYAVATVRIADQSPFTPGGSIGDLRNDWAFLELAERPTVDPVPYGGTAAARRAMAVDEPLFKVGWVGDERRRDVACTILELDADGRLLSFRCPGGAGQGRSGSALLVRTGERYEVVGVQSAEAKSAFATIGVAVVRPSQAPDNIGGVP